MSQNTIFPAQEAVVTIDCRPTPDVAVFYDGTTTAVPLLDRGNIVFAGAKTNRPSQGIGVIGSGSDFKTVYANILTGGAGVKLRCANAATQQVLRFGTTAGPGDLSLRLKPVFSCENTFEYDEEIPLLLYYRQGVYDTVEQKLTEAAKRFNDLYPHLGSAAVVTDGSEKFLHITTKYAGQRFRVVSQNGFTGPFLVVPGSTGGYTRALIGAWFTDTESTATDAIKVVEIFTTVKFPGEVKGSVTSNPNQATQSPHEVYQNIAVCFADNTNGNAALTALKNILKGPASGNLAQGYIAKLVGDECADSPQYTYTLVRQDAGDAAAHAATKTAYPAIIGLWRTSYDGTKSTYTITTASSTAPTAVTDSGDQFKKGSSTPV
ncbi:hypothetical protein [Spirosoma sordidisoli]|uniref:Uncharacterized protein n=1 Tax=Spirosoma sordidisoli TaxID=2502893 RepID=A0A4Q2UMP4_9BACT|nr:hypothetical protein [Spirosoma sordidisoli]RYC70664.1 hypothetical protein EQG79_00500 [Spirosoma sordidisoli]